MKQNEDHNQQRKDETAAMTALVNNACSSRDWRARFCAIISHDLNKTREKKLLHPSHAIWLEKTVLGHRMMRYDNVIHNHNGHSVSQSIGP